MIKKLAFISLLLGFIVPKQTFAKNPLPILDIDPNQGQEALLNYKMTKQELEIFHKMNEAVAKEPQERSLEEDYALVIPIGASYQLNPKQSIAFWVRSTFSLFEP